MVGKRWLKWAIVKRTLSLFTNNEYDFYRNTYVFSQGKIQIPRTERIFISAAVTITTRASLNTVSIWMHVKHTFREIIFHFN